MKKSTSTTGVNTGSANGSGGDLRSSQRSVQEQLRSDHIEALSEIRRLTLDNHALQAVPLNVVKA